MQHQLRVCRVRTGRGSDANVGVVEGQAVVSHELHCEVGQRRPAVSDARGLPLLDRLARGGQELNAEEELYAVNLQATEV